MSSTRIVFLSLLFGMLTGCNQYNSPFRADGFGTSNEGPDFERLLAFESDLAHSTSAGRSEVCQSLLKSQRSTGGNGNTAYLLAGRLLSDACGDIPKLLEQAKPLSAGYAPDDPMQKFIAIHVEALKRLNATTKKCSNQEPKTKAGNPGPESKDANNPKQDKTRALQEKLDAIRSLEKHLDENREEN